jgi:hypothetical protein
MQLKEQIEFLNKAVKGTWVINPDGSVDVDGWVSLGLGLEHLNLNEIPVKFGKVSGSFDCAQNNLTTLKNVPVWVGGWFDCSSNHLTSLEGCPDYVGGNFDCDDNNLKNYFKNIKEEEFKLWGLFIWGWVIKEYPFLIKIAKNYVSKERFIELVEHFPKTKLYLK